MPEHKRRESRQNFIEKSIGRRRSFGSRIVSFQANFRLKAHDATLFMSEKQSLQVRSGQNEPGIIMKMIHIFEKGGKEKILIVFFIHNCEKR